MATEQQLGSDEDGLANGSFWLPSVQLGKHFKGFHDVTNVHIVPLSPLSPLVWCGTDCQSH